MRRGSSWPIVDQMRRVRAEVIPHPRGPVGHARPLQALFGSVDVCTARGLHVAGTTIDAGVGARQYGGLCIASLNTVQMDEGRFTLVIDGVADTGSIITTRSSACSRRACFSAARLSAWIPAADATCVELAQTPASFDHPGTTSGSDHAYQVAATAVGTARSRGRQGRSGSPCWYSSGTGAGQPNAELGLPIRGTRAGVVHSPSAERTTTK